MDVEDSTGPSPAHAAADLLNQRPLIRAKPNRGVRSGPVRRNYVMATLVASLLVKTNSSMTVPVS
jgi:hypothetical protein